jgi:endonuclease/exonuclease/phosphatase family metal-dependent hydrolase
LDYPYWDYVTGFDTNIFVAVLSQFPIVARRPHTNETYLLYGRRLRVSRGFAEMDIRVNRQYVFTLMAAHLKSRRPVGVADQAEMREQEARILREKIDARLKANPQANLIVLGDFNDLKDSKTIRTLLGPGRSALVDTRPGERNGDEAAAPPGTRRRDPRTITWTHFYGVQDLYSRIDYIFLSSGMAREWDSNGTFVLALPNWGTASDHRPVVATFWAEDR